MLSDSITELANILEEFFKGLTDCHILTRYTVQLQVSELDLLTTITVKNMIQEFIKNLQRLFCKIPIIQMRENRSDTVFSTLPVYNDLPLKREEERNLCERISLTTVPTQLQFAVEMPSTNLIVQSPVYKNGCSNISNNIKSDIEKSVKINQTKCVVDKYKIPKSFHSTEINNLKCIIIPPDTELKKNDPGFLVNNNCNSTGNPVKNNASKAKIQENICKNEKMEGHHAVENNTLPKQLMLQDLSASNIPTASATENIVHIIVETADRPCNLVINENQISSETDGKLKNYVCIECNRILEGEDEIERHLQLHKPVCHICQREFATVKEIKEHSQLSHEGSRNFTCTSCSKICISLQDLKKHNFESHDSHENLNKCNICNKTFATKLGLTRHADSHGGKKTAVCDICGKSFRRSDYLQTHNAIHLGKKKFACKLCPKRFILKTHLKHHEKIHTNIKDFFCNMCNKDFSRKDKLKEHILRHLNVKKFRCNTCNKTYAENRDLQKHLKTHVKNK